MTIQLGTAERPLRVAIIGAGPAGFYAAGVLLQQKEREVAIDMFDRLPAPYGLVRYGVAPDHQKIKSVTKVYDRTAAHVRFRFFGNVDFGKDITRADLLRHNRLTPTRIDQAISGGDQRVSSSAPATGG